MKWWRADRNECMSVDGGYRPGYEIAAENILEMIVEQELRPGDRLPTEMEIATYFGLSRSVTREAIKMLVALGRVSAQRGRGLFVGSGTAGHQVSMLSGHQFIPTRMEHVEQLLKFRSVQEEFAAREASRRATPPHLNLLGQALSDGEAALNTGDSKAWENSDTRFHVGIAEASGNQFILAALQSIREMQQQIAVLALHGNVGGSLEQAQRDHAGILEAITNGDPELAAARASEHIQRTIDGYRHEIEHLLVTAGA